MNAKEALAQISASGKRFYVYTLNRPSGLPFYIGIGTGRRIFDHGYYAARGKLKSHKLAIIRKIVAIGQEMSFDIECHTDDRAIAETRERELIAQIGRADHRKGPLANNTDGGEGAHNPSAEELERRSKKLKEWWATRPDRATFLARWHSPEARAASSKRMTGKKFPNRKTPQASSRTWNADQRATISARLRADPISKKPGVAEKISASKLGKPINSWMRTAAAKERFGRGNHPRARAVEVDGRPFSCKQDAADDLGVTRSAIDFWLREEKRGARYI